ncbi:helix-turn-helix transcriptional regulator (plasmid) [Azospirillum sp. HJ39]|uniref:helix-turn-helix domain-containing protein n=1 Tax=Azospirillum sp. HJ39 TaxID=3159496 RepID=UPI003558FC0F
MITPNTCNAVQFRILAWMAAEQLSVEELAARAGVSRSALRNIKKAGWKTSFSTVRRLEDTIPPTFNVDLSKASL